MVKKQIQDIPAFVAGDETILKEVLHPKNEEIDLPYSLAHAVIPVGGKSLPHRLQKSEEVYTILKGKGMVHLEQDSFEIQEGSVFMIPKNALQSVENTGLVNLEFYCIVSPPWAEVEEEIL